MRLQTDKKSSRYATIACRSASVAKARNLFRLLLSRQTETFCSAAWQQKSESFSSNSSHELRRVRTEFSKVNF